MLTKLLEVIQLESGIGQPILEDNRPLAYIEWGWIPSIRDFLQHIVGKITNATVKPRTYRENDSYIMDDKSITKMSRKEQILINRCRIFLQVETISDIANAEGTHIKKAWFNPNDKKPSHSNLDWPGQGDPGSEAWKIWKTFLTRTYTTNDMTNTLKQKLGKWTIQNKRRTLHAYYQPINSSIAVFSKGSWSEHQLLSESRRQMFFQCNYTNIITYPKEPCYPIDIQTETNKTIITGKYEPRQEMNLDTTTHGTFQDKINQLSHNSLLKNTRIMVDDNTISELLSQKSTVDVATDGSHDSDTGKLSFGWAVAINRMVIASGSGPAMAHPDLAESFRAEGYGLASAAAFINQLITYFNADANTHKWNFHLDSMTLIQRMLKYESEVVTPKWHLWPDIDITNKAHELLGKIPVSYFHVRSHQNRTRQEEPSDMIVQMNIMADELASQYRETMTNPIRRVEDDSFCHLVINDKFITRESQRHILETSSMIPIQQYYHDKFGWNSATFHDIDWKTQHRALSSYESNDQRRLIKYCHGWLPTYERMFREKLTPSQRCPLCYYLTESNDHLFSCRHPIQQAATQELMKFLDNDTKNHGNRDLNEILKLAILHCQTPSWTPPPTTDNRDLQNCIQAQTKIGWVQIFHGRITRRFSIFMDNHYKKQGTTDKKLTGARWAKLLIKAFWDNLLTRWSQRNTIIYGNQRAEQQEIHRQRLISKVQAYYAFKHQLCISDRSKLFTKEYAELMEEDPRLIKAWTKLAGRIITAHKREQKNKQGSRALMEQYFKWHPPDGLRKLSKHQQKHPKHDLKPD
jgi:hypothetical protein